MASNPVPRKWTIEEYLAYEIETGIKHEFIDGEIYAMSGGTFSHSLIGANVSGELRTQLRQSDCSVLNSEMKIRIRAGIYVYPDVTVICGDAQFEHDNPTILMNPKLVVEVISDSSERYDTGIKVNYYQSLPSVEAYLLLAQDRPHAILHTRHELGWLKREFSGLDAIIPLEAIGCNLALSEAYLNVKFETGEE